MTIAQRMVGRTIIVTGAGAGIGRAIAHRLSEEGGWIACLDKDGAAAQDTAASLRDGSHHVIDVSLEHEVERGIREVLSARGRIDVLVNNAGIAGPQEPALSTPLDGWERTLAVNLTGTFLMARAALPALIKSGGSIVNVASALAFVGWPNECAYGTTKAGVVQLTKGMALDYASRVRVNCVCPGAVRTPMLENTLPSGADVEALFAEYGKIHPLHGRLAWPEEIANAVLFLASDDASLVTGAALLADAGFTAG